MISDEREKPRKDIRRRFVRQKTGGSRQKAVQGRDGCNRQFVLLPRLLWPLTIYEIGLPFVESLEKSISRGVRLGFPPRLSSIALYSKSARLRLPQRSIVEEYKVGKIRTLMLDGQQFRGPKYPRNQPTAQIKKEGNSRLKMKSENRKKP